MPFLAGQYAKSLIDQQLTRLDSQASMVSAADPFPAAPQWATQRVFSALQTVALCKRYLSFHCLSARLSSRTTSEASDSLDDPCRQLVRPPPHQVISDLSLVPRQASDRLGSCKVLWCAHMRVNLQGLSDFNHPQG